MFKEGFGSKSCNYWLGNELLHQLTKDGLYKLRFDLQALASGKWYWAEYSTFIVDSEATDYQLTVSGYSGTAGDAMIKANNMKFTTIDNENDFKEPGNCAFLRGGGFWWNKCGPMLVTTCESRKTNMWQVLLPKTDRSLQTSRGWLMCHAP